VGAAVCSAVGAAVGSAVGTAVGSAVGAAVGSAVGAAVGSSAVGAAVGSSAVGAAVGSAVGAAVGSAVGVIVISSCSVSDSAIERLNSMHTASSNAMLLFTMLTPFSWEDDRNIHSETDSFISLERHISVVCGLAVILSRVAHVGDLRNLSGIGYIIAFIPVEIDAACVSYLHD
nr:hypothetical protein [Clostridia bacterium]